MDSATRKRKYTWNKPVNIDDTAAKLLARKDDQEAALHLISIIQYGLDKPEHKLDALEKRIYYTLEFSKINKISHGLIVDLVNDINQVKDIKFKVSKIEPSIIIQAQLYYTDDTLRSPPLPMFTKYDVTESPLDESSFSNVMCGNDNGWKAQWKEIYSTVKSVADCVYNMEEYPPQIKFSIAAADVENGKEITIKFQNFGSIAYSFLEYVSDIVAKKFLFGFSFEFDKDGKGFFGISFLYSDNEKANDKYLTTIPRRALLESGLRRQVFNAAESTKRKREEETFGGSGDSVEQVTVVEVDQKGNKKSRASNILLKLFGN